MIEQTTKQQHPPILFSTIGADENLKKEIYHFQRMLADKKAVP